jgi:hypothetical protein
VFEQPKPLQTWLEFAVGVPLACSMIVGCVIWGATHTFQGTVAEAHKLKAVVAMSASGLAIVFLFYCSLVADAPTHIFGLDQRAYTLGVVMLVAWSAHSYAGYGAIRWGAALIRISAVMALIAVPMYYIIEHEEAVVSVWQGLTKPIADSEAAAGLGSAFAACVLGVVGAVLVNMVYTKDVAETRYVLSKGCSRLEQLLCSAGSLARMILLTMDDGKVYVGTVKRVAMRGNADPYIVIYPTISGYRTQTQEVAFTTFYQRVYEYLGEEASEQFQKVLPMRRVVCAAYYDQHHHDTFFGLKVSVPSSAARTPE